MTKFFEGNPVSDGASYLRALAVAFNSNEVNGIVEIPKSEGAGNIRMIEVSEGLSMLMFDFELKNNTAVQNVALHSALRNTFLIFAILTPKQLTIQKAGQPVCVSGLGFSLVQEQLEFSITAGSMVKAVALVISENWLKEYCEEVQTDLLFMIPNLVGHTKSRLCMESAGHSIFHTMVTMHNNAIADLAPDFYLKAKTVSILSDVLTGFRPEENHHIHDNELTHSRMLTIEKILDDHLHNNLPSISAIAKQAVLSESTLKRNFKQMYGVSIYEYYLQKKMQLARQLLDEKPIVVKEVGYMLGYEKTSNFIKAFKKYYDLSPGSFKKKAS